MSHRRIFFLSCVGAAEKMPLSRHLTLLLTLFSTHNVLATSHDIFVANCRNLSREYHEKTCGIFFFVFFFYLNFFLFKKIKKILINTYYFCFIYQINFFLKYFKKLYV